MAKDIITKYYDKRDPHKKRKYYNSLDELFTAKGRIEYVISFPVETKNIEIEVKCSEAPYGRTIVLLKQAKRSHERS